MMDSTYKLKERRYRNNMIKLTFSLCLLFFLATYTPVDTQEVAESQATTKMAPAAEDFQKIIKDYSYWSLNVDNPYYYKDQEFKPAFSETTIKFAELPDDAKAVHYLEQAKDLTLRLFIHSVLWDVQLKAAKEEADKTGITNYLNQLLQLRKEHAKRYEALMDKVLNSVKDITAEEKAAYRIWMKSFHKQQKLIE